MGTDIHMITQVRESGIWHTVPDVAFHDRSYNTFAQLADVRNGRGFAGCDTGSGFIPVAAPRGLPEGVSERPEGEPDDEDYDDRPWLGDHSHSWLTLAELLAYDVTRTSTLRGVISIDQYRAWDGVSQPDDWCGDIFGRAVRVGTQEDADAGKDVTHVRVSWVRTYRDAAQAFWTDFVPRLRLLAAAPKDVRIVFGFDS